MSEEEGTEVEFAQRLSPESSRRDGRPVHEFLRRRDLEYSLSQCQLTGPATQEGIKDGLEDGSNDSGDEHVSGEVQYEMQQGENWLKLTKKDSLNAVLFTQTQDINGGQSIGSHTPTILSLEGLGIINAPINDCYLCVDVDAAILVIKDMRPPSSCDKGNSNDSGGWDDDGVGGFIFGISRSRSNPPQWEALPRRQMRTFQSGDLLCTSLMESSEQCGPSPVGIVLEYKKSYRRENSKMDDSSDASRPRNDSPVANSHTSSPVAKEALSQADTPASYSMKAQPLLTQFPLTQPSQPSQLSQPISQLTNLKHENDEASVDSQERGGKPEDPMKTDGDQDSDKTMEIPSAVGNDESNTMLATQPDADTSDDDTTLGDESRKEGSKLEDTTEAQQTMNIGEKSSTNGDVIPTETLVGDTNGDEKKKSEATVTAESDNDAQGVGDEQNIPPAKDVRGVGNEEIKADENLPVKSDNADTQGIGDEQNVPAAKDVDFSPTLCGETEDPPIPESKNTQSSESLLSPSKYAHQTDSSVATPVENGTMTENRNVKETDGEKLVSAATDTEQKNSEMPEDGASRTKADEVEKAVNDDDDDDGSETDVSEVLLSETPISKTSTEKRKLLSSSKQETASSPANNRRQEQDNSDVTSPEDDTNNLNLKPVSLTERKQTTSSPPVNDHLQRQDSSEVTSPEDDTKKPPAKLDSAEDRKQEDTECKDEPSGNDDPSSDSTENEQTQVPVSKKRAAESSETVIPTTPATKRSRTTRNDPRAKARGTHAVDCTPQTHSTRKRRRQSFRAESPGAHEEELSIRIMTTGVVLTNSQKATIERLGGVLLEKIEDAASATHIIAGDGKASLRRTPKLMIGLCKTANIVNLEWLLKSAKSRKVLPTNDFRLLSDKEAERQYHFSMQETLSRAETMRSQGSSLLGGYNVHVCSGVAGNTQKGNMTPPSKEFRLIIEAAGGKWLASVPDANKKSLDFAKIILVVSKVEKDAKKSLSAKRAGEAKRNGAMIMTTEQLFSSMMTQKLDG